MFKLQEYQYVLLPKHSFLRILSFVNFERNTVIIQDVLLFIPLHTSSMQTYFGVDVSAIKDDIHRRALETMIETYGQTPLQLFSNPHPKRFTKAPSSLIEMLPQTMESMIILNNPSKPKDSSAKESSLNDQLLLPDGK